MESSSSRQKTELEYEQADEFQASLAPSSVFECLREAKQIVQHAGFAELGEAYIRGNWHCEPAELRSVLERVVTSTSASSLRSLWQIVHYMVRDRLLNLQSGDRAYQVAHRHYDLGNDLFRAMLDESMSYTSAHWPPGCHTLAQAQLAKLELICQKLQLSPGMRVLDIGCGWGNFAHYAAQKYGVTVVGLTVSREQAQFARERCRNLPVTIELIDYRKYQASFDRVVSIEMIEAVGRKNIPQFFSMVERNLNPEGLFLLQVISGETFCRASDSALNQFVLWLLKYIFPNGYLPRLSQLTAATRQGLHMQQLQSLEGDYEKTLQAWKTNFEKQWSKLAPVYGEKFHRMWDFYLCGCMVFFKLQLVQVYQILYSKSALCRS